MLDLNINTILEFLKEQKLAVQKQIETNQIIYIFQVDNQDVPLFMRVVEESELVQLLAFIPGSIKEGLQGDVARFMHFLNKQLDIPGYGMDESSGVMFYRYILAAPEKKVSEIHLITLINSIELLSQAFSHLILSVASGKLTFKEGIKKLQEIEKAIADKKE